MNPPGTHSCSGRTPPRTNPHRTATSTTHGCRDSSVPPCRLQVAEGWVRTIPPQAAAQPRPQPDAQGIDEGRAALEGLRCDDAPAQASSRRSPIFRMNSRPPTALACESQNGVPKTSGPRRLQQIFLITREAFSTLAPFPGQKNRSRNHNIPPANCV